MLTLKNNADQFKPWAKYTWFQAISKHFERLGIAPGLSTDFSKNLNILMQYAFRKEMEERRMPGSSLDDQNKPDADAEFVEQIKADAESAPTIEDTIPKEGE